MEQLLNVARGALVHQKQGVYGRRPGDPFLGTGLKVRAPQAHPCPGATPVAGAGHVLVVVLNIQCKSGTDLAQVREACGLPRLRASLGKAGEEDRRERSDDGDHHEKLDQGKARFRPPRHEPPPLPVSTRWHE